MEVQATNKKKEFIKFIKFLFFSLSAGVIQIVSDTIMVEVFHWRAALSSLIALVLSVVWNFTLNRKFTFHSANNVPIAMFKVALFYLVFSPMSFAWTHGLVEMLHWNNYLVLAITMIINFITEFFYQKYFVFD